MWLSLRDYNSKLALKNREKQIILKWVKYYDLGLRAYQEIENSGAGIRVLGSLLNCNGWSAGVVDFLVWLNCCASIVECEDNVTLRLLLPFTLLKSFWNEWDLD